MRDGQDTTTAATTLFRRALRQESTEEAAQTTSTAESAYEALNDFIGKFDSRLVREEERVPPSDDPCEQAYGEIIAEKYRKQASKYDSLRCSFIGCLLNIG